MTPNWTYAAPATPSSGPSGSPALTSATTGLAQFDAGGIAFAYPAAWNEARFEVASSFSEVIVYLSTAQLADPCDRSPGTIACTREAAAGLGPSGVLVEWTHRGFPGWSFDPGAGASATIGGRTATVADLPADERCAAIGGGATVLATIPNPAARWNWDEMRACLRGPDTAAVRAQLQAMLTSVRWTQP